MSSAADGQHVTVVARTWCLVIAAVLGAARSAFPGDEVRAAAVTPQEQREDAGLLTKGAKTPKYVPVLKAKGPTQQLIADLSSGDPSVRAHSAWQLAGIMEMRAEARVALESVQTDADRSVRYAAAWALGHLRLPDTPTDETAPTVIQRAKLEYPMEAYAGKIFGTVVVDVLVGEEGEVSHVEVRQSIRELDGAALACLRQWRFDPARVGGVPRAALVSMPVAFSLTVPKVIDLR